MNIKRLMTAEEIETRVASGEEPLAIALDRYERLINPLNWEAVKADPSCCNAIRFNPLCVVNDRCKGCPALDLGACFRSSEGCMAIVDRQQQAFVAIFNESRQEIAELLRTKRGYRSFCLGCDKQQDCRTRAWTGAPPASHVEKW